MGRIIVCILTVVLFIIPVSGCICIEKRPEVIEEKKPEVIVEEKPEVVIQAQPEVVVQENLK